MDFRPAVFVDEAGLTVIGIRAEVERQPTLLDAIIISDGTARDAFGVPASDAVHIRTVLGAGRVIGASLALAPEAPEQLAVRVPPEPEHVRATVASDVRAGHVVR